MSKILLGIGLYMAIFSSAFGEIEQIVLKLDGMNHLRGYELEKTLKKVAGVAKVDIFFQKDTAILTPAPGRLVDIESIAGICRKASFSVREMTVEATGRVMEWNGHPALDVPKNETRFLLATSDAEKLRELVQKNATVSISGKLEVEIPPGHHSHPYHLRVETLRLVR